MRILWSPQSLRDLDAIHGYIAKDSEHYAGLTIARIFSAVEQLIQFPRSGRIVPERDEPEIREVISDKCRQFSRHATLEEARCRELLLQNDLFRKHQ